MMANALSEIRHCLKSIILQPLFSDKQKVGIKYKKGRGWMYNIGEPTGN